MPGVVAEGIERHFFLARCLQERMIPAAIAVAVLLYFVFKVLFENDKEDRRWCPRFVLSAVDVVEGWFGE